VRESLACYQRSADLIQLGAYVSGSNPKLDNTLKVRDELMSFLRQDSHETFPMRASVEGLDHIAARLTAQEVR
jgi:flagellar biosynthesis/type III secretory pathway ATPase